MSLCDGRALFANDKEVARRRSGAASKDSDEVIHEKRRQACRRINQWVLNSLTCISYGKAPVHRGKKYLSGAEHTPG